MKASGGFEPFALSWRPTLPQLRSLSAARKIGNAEFDATRLGSEQIGENWRNLAGNRLSLPSGACNWEGSVRSGAVLAALSGAWATLNLPRIWAVCLAVPDLRMGAADPMK